MQRLITYLKFALIIYISCVSISAQEQLSNNQNIESASWIKVSPKGAGFSVLMPGTPKEDIAAVEIASKKVPSLSYMVNIGESSFYAQRWGDFPEELVKAGYLDTLFNNVHKVLFEEKGKDGRITSVQFTQRNISLGPYTGREYQAECGPYKKISGPCGSTIRVYKVDRSLFVVGMVGLKQVQLGEQTAKFFSSFTLTRE